MASEMGRKSNALFTRPAHACGAQRSGARAQTGRGQEAMAQWQRVRFQIQRLGVRIPRASCFIFCCRYNKIKFRAASKTSGVLLLDYFD